MQILGSQAVPIYPGYTAKISSVPRPFGRKVFSGLNGCGCGPVNGCNCTSPSGFAGLGQTSSLDQIIANTFSWLGGTVQASLPASASVAPQYGTAGSLSATIQTWIPWIIGGYLVYKVISK